MNTYLCDGCGEVFDHNDSPCFDHPEFNDPVCEQCFDTLEEEADDLEAQRDREEAQNRDDLRRVVDAEVPDELRA